jgi:hypothetical protein
MATSFFFALFFDLLIIPPEMVPYSDRLFASVKNLVEARHGVVVVFDHPFRPRRVELQSLR